ncbi:MAG: hypothetical protein ACREPF_05120 [Rhodanobacteraceae bacterium]
MLGTISVADTSAVVFAECVFDYRYAMCRNGHDSPLSRPGAAGNVRGVAKKEAGRPDRAASGISSTRIQP